VDESEQARLIAKVAGDAAELLVTMRRERDCRRAAGDTVWLDQVLHELEPLVEQIHDLEIFQAIRAVVERHGAGPYPATELAAIAGADTESVRRVLAQMVTEGLASDQDQRQ
jgi:hypothetical protein